MDLAGVRQLFEDLARHRAGFYYGGRFPEDHSALLISLAEALTALHDDGPTARRLAFILVEAYQNIIRHSAPQEEGRSLQLKSVPGGYLISASNPVRNEEVQIFKEMLAGIDRNNDLKQLKEMFLRRLQGESTSQRGGAGLGLIEMARRSANGIKYIFENGTGDVPLFKLDLFVGKSVDPKGSRPMNERAPGCILAYHGELSPTIQSVLHSMVTHEVDAERHANAFLNALEALSDTLGQTGTPLIVLTHDLTEWTIQMALPFASERADRMYEAIKSADVRTEGEKQTEYRKVLMGRDRSHELSLGMLDLIRRAQAPIDMALFPHMAGSVLVMNVRI